MDEHAMFVEFYAMPLTTAGVRTALPRTRLYRLSDRLGFWKFRRRDRNDGDFAIASIALRN